MSDERADSATPDSSASGSAATNLPGSAGLAGSQWPAKVAGTVEDVVAAVHDRVIRPLLLAARAIVFGLVAATMVVVLIVLFSIAAIRLLDVYAFNHRVWPAYAVIGGVLVLGGAAAWSRRKPAGAKEG
jgi:hypothetical protein